MAVVLLTFLQAGGTVCLVPKLPEPRADPLLDHGYVGVQIIGDDPVVISDVVVGGPAEAAGMKVDDVILRVNERDARTREDVIGMVASCRPGEVVIIDVRRGTETVTLKIRCIIRDPAEFLPPPGAPSPYARVPDPS